VNQLLGPFSATPEEFGSGGFTLKKEQMFSVHTTSQEFENGVFTLKTHQMFSVHTTTPEEFADATITGHFGCVVEKNSDKEIF